LCWKDKQVVDSDLSTGLCTTIDSWCSNNKSGEIKHHPNTVPEAYFPENTYPNIKFFSQKDKNTPIQFSGKSGLEEILEFVQCPIWFGKIQSQHDSSVKLQEKNHLKQHFGHNEESVATKKEIKIP